jgi:hypothetical protein
MRTLLCYGPSADSAAPAHLCCHFRRRFFVSLAFSSNTRMSFSGKDFSINVVIGLFSGLLLFVKSGGKFKIPQFFG